MRWWLVITGNRWTIYEKYPGGLDIIEGYQLTSLENPTTVFEVWQKWHT